MNRLWTFAVCILIGCGATLALSTSLQAELRGAPVPFSADWAILEDGELMDGGRYYAGSEGIRLEGEAGGQPYITIYNFERKLAWILMVEQRMYTEVPFGDADQLGMGELGQFGTPCPPDAQAERSSAETLAGREVEIWLCMTPGADTRTVWFDTRLQTPIRSESDEELFELKNIEEGPLPANLFVPPSDFVKM